MPATRTGPRGVTIGDIARVASVGSRAMPTQTPVTPGRISAPRNTPNIPIEDIVSQIIGGQASTYGAKYGGYPTQSQFESAVLGQAYRIPEFATMMQTRADEAMRNLAGYADMQSDIRRPGSMASAELAAMQAASAQPLATPQLDAVARRLEAERKVAESIPLPAVPLFGSPAEAPIGLGESRREDIRMIRNASPAGDLAQRMTDQEYRNAMMGRQMERMSALTPLAPVGTSPSYGEIATGRVQPDIARVVQQDVERNVLPYQQAAQQLGNMPLYELARQIATQVYGTPDALAAGLFTPQVDVSYGTMMQDYENEMNRRRGIDTTLSTAELILQNYGPDALQEYQNAQAAGAIEKATGTLGTAEEQAFDQAIIDSTGVSPESAAGDFPTDMARTLLSDQNFVDALGQARNQVAQSDLDLASEKRNLAFQLAAEYEKTVGPVAAQIFLDALLSFDYLYTDKTE